MKNKDALKMAKNDGWTLITSKHTQFKYTREFARERGVKYYFSDTHVQLLEESELIEAYKEMHDKKLFLDQNLIGVYYDNNYRVFTQKEADERGLTNIFPVYYNKQIKKHFVMIDYLNFKEAK